MKIGLLVTGHVPDPLQDAYGDYDAVFSRFLTGQGLELRPWFVVENAFPSGPEEADGWLITGSRHGVYEDHDWIAPLEALIRAIRDAGKPLVGICFGHQIIAQALGGRVEKFAGGWAVGRTVYQTENGPLTLNAWHQDQVIEAPEGARVLASNDFCRNAVLAYGERIWTVQPHPEFTPDYLQDLARVRGPGVVPEERLARAIDEAGGPNDNAALALQIAEFFKRATCPA